jgi:hypothetical protein
LLLCRVVLLFRSGDCVVNRTVQRRATAKLHRGLETQRGWQQRQRGERRGRLTREADLY